MAAITDIVRRRLIGRLGFGPLRPEALQVGEPSAATRDRGAEAQIALVAGADRRLAEAGASGERD